MEHLTQEIATIRKKDDIHQKIRAINTEIKKNNEDKQSYQNEMNLLSKQQQKFENWNLLYDLIGSSDGKKYRNFAKSLTFQVVIHNANIYLRKMNERYLLVQNTTELLTLDVIDNYQAG